MSAPGSVTTQELSVALLNRINQLGDLTTLSTTAKGDLVAAINELFLNVSNGKTNIATAITGMGVAAAGSDTFAQLSTKIGNISKDSTAVVSQILLGQTAYIAGAKATGTMPNNGAVNFTPSASAQTIPVGYTTGGTVAAVTVPAANVLTGTTIAGVAGTMPNNGAPTWTPSTVNQGLAAGYYGGGTVLGSANLVAANILSGVNIFGVVGTVSAGLQNAKSSIGLGAGTQNASINFSGLNFTPKYAMAMFQGGSLNNITSGGAAGCIMGTCTTDSVNFPADSSGNMDYLGSSGRSSCTFSVAPTFGGCTVRLATGHPSGYYNGGTMTVIVFG